MINNKSKLCLIAPAISNLSRYGEKENIFKEIGNGMPTMALLQLASVAQKQTQKYLSLMDLQET